MLEILRRDHENLAGLLDLFERQLDQFEAAAVPDYDMMVSILDYCASFPDRFHHPLEDRIMVVLRKRDPTAVKPVGSLRTLHEALAVQTQEVMALLRTAQQGMAVPRADLLEAGRDFIQSYRQHMALEDRNFFPAAEQALTAEDWADIEAMWMGPFDPLFDGRDDEHYRRLRQELLSVNDGPDAS